MVGSYKLINFQGAKQNLYIREIAKIYGYQNAVVIFKTYILPRMEYGDVFLTGPITGI